MAPLSDYVSGTVSVAADSTAVTGVGTAWLTAGFREGDVLYAAGFSGIVLAVNSNTSLTLDQPWKGGEISGAPYRLRYQGDGSRVSAQARALIEILGNTGNLQSFAALEGGADRLPYFTGAGTFGLTVLSGAARDLLSSTSLSVVGGFAEAREVFSVVGDVPRLQIKNDAVQFRWITGSNGTSVIQRSTDDFATLVNLLSFLADRVQINEIAEVTGQNPRLQIDNGAQQFRWIGDGVGGSLIQRSTDKFATLRNVINFLADRVQVADSLLVSGSTPRLGLTNGAVSWRDILTAAGTIIRQRSLDNFVSNFTDALAVSADQTQVNAALLVTGATPRIQWLNGAIAWRAIEGADGAIYFQRSPDNFAASLSETLSLGAAGAVHVWGALSKASGTFLIDHPLDPANRDLAHGFVEAPRYDLIYRGVAQLVEGRAEVDIDAASNMTPGTFAALTVNCVVTSLQNQDGFARVRPGPIAGGSFSIECEDIACADTVSWVVIAERNDAYVRHLDKNCDEAGRFIPEREKPEYEDHADV